MQKRGDHHKKKSKKTRVDRVVIDLGSEPAPSFAEDVPGGHVGHLFDNWFDCSNKEIPCFEARWIGDAAHLRVLSWNILASEYTFNHFYPHLGKNAGKVLSWAHRVKMIVSTIELLDADVMCLQEVDKWPEMLALLSSKYDGCFEQRTGHKVDGLAILWKRDVAEMVGQKEVLKFDDKMGAKDGESRIALRVCLKVLNSNRLLAVCQTHLDYKRPRSQVEMCRLLSDFVKDAIRECRDACIVCGDFNSELRSDAVRTLTEALPRLASAVPQTNSTGAPVYTAVIKEPKCIDHLLFDKKFLNQKGLLAPFMSSAKLPNESFPSDHYPVGAAFEFLTK